MKDVPSRTPARWVGIVCFALAASAVRAATNEPASRDDFLQLQRQNEQLQRQMNAQQKVIDSLTRKVSDLENAAASNSTATTQPPESAPESALHFGPVNLSGEGAFGFFDSGPQGQMPDTEFRVDEARLFLAAPVWDDVYFFTEVDLATREKDDLALRYAELYLNFEDISQLWGRDGMLNLRVGRFYIPFGEEYQNRFAIDNPLISHSVSDIWGEDNGLELYGALGPVHYVVAVQNGGAQASQDFTDDKSVTARIGYDPTPWLHVSASGMRTGSLSVQDDMLSAVWFGNGFFRSIGGPGTTTFGANLAEGDVQIRTPCLQFRGAGGYINYSDNDPAGSNHRDVYYFYTEGVHDITSRFYCAARFSEVFAHNGFPIVGNGNFGEYLFDELTSQYWRLSLGLGYKFSRNLIVKGEYSFNRGREFDGTPRDNQDLYALEAACRF